MPTVVYFTKNNARVIKGAVAWSKDLPHLVDPDFTPVKGIAPHYWKIADGKLAPMNVAERALRSLQTADHKTVNTVPLYRTSSVWPHLFLAFSAGCAIGATVLLYLR